MSKKGYSIYRKIADDITDLPKRLLGKYKAWRDDRVFRDAKSIMGYTNFRVALLYEIQESTSHMITCYPADFGVTLKRGTYTCVGESKHHKVKHLKFKVLYVSDTVVTVQILAKTIVKKIS